jgi:2-polyprenyl-3-methyl-5-hydroxy-6-metoxy-1,4-benzoquinol methylase
VCPGWNHNVEYHRVVREALGAPPSRVLDVGTGDGLLARELAAVGHEVTAIDVDAPTIARARAQANGAPIDFVVGDVMSHPLEPESFDGVVSIATLHHLPEAAALARLAALVRPGGTVVVVGLARSRPPHDAPWDLAGAVLTRLRRRQHGGYLDVQAPTVWPPPSTYREIRRLGTTALPGARYRRHVLWRYSLVWTRPAHASV